MPRKTGFIRCLAVYIIFFAVLMPVTASGAEGPIIVLDGRVRVYDVSPFIEENRTMVPLRGIFENLGASVTWDGVARTVTAKKGETTILLGIGNRTAHVNQKPVVLDVPARIVGSRTFVPLRFIFEALGSKVEWDEVTRTIYIYSTEDKVLGNITTEKTVQQVAEESKSVVKIITLDLWDEELATGSGFAVADDLVLTNFHVIEGASRAKIALEDGTWSDVLGVVAYDPERDVALLKTAKKDLQPVIIGKSGELRPGVQVVAIGSPVGLTNTVSDGIISSLNRVFSGQRFLQTSAPISPGSSGGALFNMKGEVIGITTAIYTGGQNLNLAIPVDEVKDMIKDGEYLTLPVGQADGNSSNYSGFIIKLLNELGTAQVGSSIVSFVSGWANDSEDSSTVMMGLILDDEHYLNLLNGLEDAGGEEQFNRWLTEIVVYTEKEYPDKNVFGGVMYLGEWDTYPQSFPPESISTSPDGTKWRVGYRVLFFYDQEDWVYFDWNDK